MTLLAATENLLATGRMRDEPNDRDRKDARDLLARIQQRREALGLKPLTDQDGPVVSSIEIDGEDQE